MDTHLAGQQCPWCLDEAHVEIHEAWGHEFMLDTCCEGMHHHYANCLSQGGSDAAALLKSNNISDVLSHELRGIGIDGPSFELDYKLMIRPVRFGICKAFVHEHHHHCRPPAGWKYGAGCFNGHTLVGVAMCGRPVARMLDAATTIEVNRLCLDRNLSNALRRNASSMLLGFSAREAQRRGYEKIITYTLESEGGGSLRAAGWTMDAKSRGGTWSRPSRTRGESGPTEPKVRWARILKPKRTASR